MLLLRAETERVRALHDPIADLVTSHTYMQHAQTSNVIHTSAYIHISQHVYIYTLKFLLSFFLSLRPFPFCPSHRRDWVNGDRTSFPSAANFAGPTFYAGVANFRMGTDALLCERNGARSFEMGEGTVDEHFVALVEHWSPRFLVALLGLCVDFLSLCIILR